MKDLSEIIYRFRCLRAKRRYNNRLREENIYKIAHGHTKEKLTMSKALTIFLIAQFLIIELVAIVVTFLFRDTTAITTLISSTIGEVVIFMIYSIKSGAENVSKIKNNNTDNNAVG